MNPRIVVRPRADSDLPALAKVLVRVHAVDGYPVEGIDDPQGWLTMHDAFGCWTATVDGVPVGHVALVHPSDGDDLTKAWRAGTGDEAGALAIIARLFVDPNSRRLGLGRALMDAAIAKANELRKSVALDVMTKDVDARRLYARLGFQVIGEGDHPYGDGRTITAVFLARQLGNGG